MSGTTSDRAKKGTRVASSSLAASLVGSTGFIGFGSGPAPGALTSGAGGPSDTPGLSTELAFAFRQLAKKDALTRTKALEAVRKAYSQQPQATSSTTSSSSTTTPLGEDLAAGLQHWAFAFQLVLEDPEVRVREAAHNTNAAVVMRARAAIAPHLAAIVPPWLLGRFDQAREVAAAAREAWATCFPDPAKAARALVVTRSAWAGSLRGCLGPSMGGSDQAKEAQDRRTVSALGALEAVSVALAEGHEADEELTSLLGAATWGLLRSKSAPVRAAAFRLVASVSSSCATLIAPSLGTVSPLVLGALADKDSSVHRPIFEAIVALVKNFPEALGMVDIKGNVMPKLLGLCKEAGLDAVGAGILYDGVLPLVSLLKASLTPRSAASLLAAILAGLPAAHVALSADLRALLYRAYYDVWLYTAVHVSPSEPEDTRAAAQALLAPVGQLGGGKLGAEAEATVGCLARCLAPVGARVPALSTAVWAELDAFFDSQPAALVGKVIEWLAASVAAAPSAAAARARLVTSVRRLFTAKLSQEMVVTAALAKSLGLTELVDWEQEVASQTLLATALLPHLQEQAGAGLVLTYLAALPKDRVAQVWLRSVAPLAVESPAILEVLATALEGTELGTSGVLACCPELDSLVSRWKEGGESLRGLGALLGSVGGEGLVSGKALSAALEGIAAWLALNDDQGAVATAEQAILELAARAASTLAGAAAAGRAGTAASSSRAMILSNLVLLSSVGSVSPSGRRRRLADQARAALAKCDSAALLKVVPGSLGNLEAAATSELSAAVSLWREKTSQSSAGLSAAGAVEQARALARAALDVCGVVKASDPAASACAILWAGGEGAAAELGRLMSEIAFVGAAGDHVAGVTASARGTTCDQPLLPITGPALSEARSAARAAGTSRVVLVTSEECHLAAEAVLLSGFMAHGQGRGLAGASPEQVRVALAGVFACTTLALSPLVDLIDLRALLDALCAELAASPALRDKVVHKAASAALRRGGAFARCLDAILSSIPADAALAEQLASTAADVLEQEEEEEQEQEQDGDFDHRGFEDDRGHHFVVGCLVPYAKRCLGEGGKGSSEEGLRGALSLLCVVARAQADAAVRAIGSGAPTKLAAAGRSLAVLASVGSLGVEKSALGAVAELVVEHYPASLASGEMNDDEVLFCASVARLLWAALTVGGASAGSAALSDFTDSQVVGWLSRLCRTSASPLLLPHAHLAVAAIDLHIAGVSGGSLALAVLPGEDESFEVASAEAGRMSLAIKVFLRVCAVTDGGRAGSQGPVASLVALAAARALASVPPELLAARKKAFAPLLGALARTGSLVLAVPAVQALERLAPEVAAAGDQGFLVALENEAAKSGKEGQAEKMALRMLPRALVESLRTTEHGEAELAPHQRLVSSSRAEANGGGLALLVADPPSEEMWMALRDADGAEVSFSGRTLLAWHLLAMLTSESPSLTRARACVGSLLQFGGACSAVLGTLFAMGQYVEEGLTTAQITGFTLASLDPASPRSWGLFAWSLIYRLMLAVPSAVRSWRQACPRDAGSLVDTLAVRLLSPGVLSASFASLATSQALAGDPELTVSVNRGAREITAVCEIEAKESSSRLVIRLPASYPLRFPDVEVIGGKASGLTDAEQRKARFSLLSHFAHQGSLADAILQWKSHLNKVFDEVDECSICYSFIHVVDGTIPRLKCKTESCSCMFHNDCILKWFKSSLRHTCPMCTNPW